MFLGIYLLLYDGRTNTTILYGSLNIHQLCRGLNVGLLQGKRVKDYINYIENKIFDRFKQLDIASR